MFLPLFIACSKATKRDDEQQITGEAMFALHELSTFFCTLSLSRLLEARQKIDRESTNIVIDLRMKHSRTSLTISSRQSQPRDQQAVNLIHFD